MTRAPIATIRSYEAADLDAVIAVFVRSVREVSARDYNQAQVDAWAQADGDWWGVVRASRPTWVAVMGEDVVGFSDLEPDGHLDMMFVHPTHQSRGIAASLLSAVEAATGGQGLCAFFTEASLTARPFFERRGFELVA